MKKGLLLLGVVFSSAGLGQHKAIDRYLTRADPTALTIAASGDRSIADIQRLLPHRVPAHFVAYLESKASQQGFEALLHSLETLRLNKLIGNSGGASGVTSLVSRVAVPAVLGYGVEYGSILQQNNATVSTLRANLLGVAQTAFGAEQFPYCPEIDHRDCGTARRWLRRFSASIAFENVRETMASVPANPPNGDPVVSDLFGNDFRMASWGAHFDWTGSNNLDDPKYVSDWSRKTEDLRKDPASLAVSKAIDDFFTNVLADRENESSQETEVKETYVTWMTETVAILRSASGTTEFLRLMEERLDLLIQEMAETDPNFAGNVNALRRAYSNYFDVRDRLLRELHRHKFSLEYTNQHPLNQLYTSNARLVYSHQPDQSPTLLTLNVGFTVYHNLSAGVDSGRLRDVQLAGQLDVRLGQMPRFGHAVATIAAYYQWMKEDAVIRIGAGDVAPGSGIAVPGTAATLLGTKGHIGVVQGKLSIPIANTVKVPISITWANRTELIKEEELRGQIGLTLDLDGLFH